MNRRPMSIVVCLSGQGRSLDNLVRRADEGGLPVDIRGVIASRPDAGGLTVAESHGIESVTIQSRDYSSPESLGQAVFGQAGQWKADLVVLAGYLSLVDIPARMCNRVINIHPALLPAFGGRGMYGRHVHRAVLDHGCKVTGCTVHFASNEYDAGPIILQASCPVKSGDHPGKLASRVFGLECKALPTAIELLAAGQVIEWRGRTLILGKAGRDAKSTARSDIRAIQRWSAGFETLEASTSRDGTTSALGEEPGVSEAARTVLTSELPGEFGPFSKMLTRNPLYLLGRWGIELPKPA